MVGISANRIDVHQHIVPPPYAKLLRERGIQPGGLDIPQWSREGALTMMDRNQIARAMLSVSAPGALLTEAKEAEPLARFLNEFTAEVVAQDADRFGFFATVAFPNSSDAEDELAYAFDTLHADGVILMANTNGKYLGEPEFRPLLKALNRRSAVVFIHPGELPGPTVEGVPSFAADFLLDTTRTVLSLVLSGALKQYPRIRFILPHAGGFCRTSQIGCF